MSTPFRLVRRFFNRFLHKEKDFVSAIGRITGYTPVNPYLYQLAVTPASGSAPEQGKRRESNERLEFLGDAILGSVVAEYLFLKYPYKDEGFLTEIRSRIVNRESLNLVATKIGLSKLIRLGQAQQSRHKFVNGNALEALVGAVYLDKGYGPCRRFILRKIIKPFFDLDNLVNTTANHKSKLIEWAQAQSKAVRFELVSQKTSGNSAEFTVQALLDEQPVATGNGLSKKKAEQAAAEKALAALQVL